VITKDFVYRVLVRFYFFTAAHFHLAGARISHFLTASPLLNFYVFLPKNRNSCPLFLISRSSFFSVIQVSVDIKNNVGKDTTLLFFFLSKSPGGHPISFQINLELHLGCHTCWLSSFILVCPWCGRTGGRTVTWLLGCIGYQIVLPMVLRCALRTRYNDLFIIILISISYGVIFSSLSED